MGGFLVTYLSWHWIFYINVPIGILGAVILVTIFIDEMKGQMANSICASMVLASSCPR